MKALSHLLLAVLLINTAHGLDGQVFVVTKGRDNVKMGGVSVAAYRTSEFNDAIAKVAATLAPEFHAMEEQIARIDREIKVAQISLQSTHRLENRRAELKKTITRGYPKVWDGLHSVTPLATAVTDADGRFRINVNGNAGVILFARASRRVVDSTEHYLWVERSEGESVILSNSQDMGDGWAAAACKRAYADFVAEQNRKNQTVATSTPRPTDTRAAVRQAEVSHAPLSLVSVGMTRAQVAAQLGEPTAKGDSKWFYVGRGWVRFDGDKVSSVDTR